jgi:hypothetical protein
MPLQGHGAALIDTVKSAKNSAPALTSERSDTLS